MNHLQGSDAVVFGDDTTRADFAGGDHLDVDACIRQGPEHPCRCSGRGWHPGSDGTDPRDRRSLLKAGSGPLAQQGGQGLLRPTEIVAAQGEAQVTAEGIAAAMGALRLHDGIEADVGFRQRPADRRRRTGAAARLLPPLCLSA